MSQLTHRVAAAAYIFRDDKVLLLKRVAPPQTFAPPGGRLDVNEDPFSGVLREVKEETGLDPEIFGVASAWFGQYAEGESLLLCINYLAIAELGEPRLSDEHSEYVWASRSDLTNGRVRTQDENGRGYQAASVLDAFDRYESWMAIGKL
jgi:8-oxo-dGTP diphosphatase